MSSTEPERSAALAQAQKKAHALFSAVEARGLIRPGISENALNEEIHLLAQEMYGIKTYWHKRIVRSGSNTLLPYDENPPDLVLEKDDILFLDLGPVFEDWEADFGRTFVLGQDPQKHRLCRDIGSAFAEGKAYFKTQARITGSEYFRYLQSLAVKYGWEFGGQIGGHLIGHFPHERIPGDKVSLYVHPQNHNRMNDPDAHGQQRHWILEIHFVDRSQKIGGFYEELLTVG
jgi:Xaa-Pro dipeptidase